MKRFIHIVFSCLLFSSSSFAQVKADSYYFVAGLSDLTPASKMELDSFANKMLIRQIQVIEINGFVDDPATKNAKKISAARIDTFINYLNLNSDEITINNFSTKRERVAFKVDNWDRIDVYYYEGERKTEPIVQGPPEKDSIQDRQIELPEKIKDEEKEISYSTPYILPIKFKGGTNKVLPESIPYLDALVDTMNNNTFLTAHIRGHVCCGNNMRISKKRAKAVYKYLIKHGVESHRLSFKGYSNTMPIVFPERTQEDRAKNRRVDIIFNNGTDFIVDD